MALISILLSACSGKGDTGGSGSSGGGDTGEATLTAQPAPTVTLPPSALGSATFAQDQGKSKSVEYPADGKSVTLQVTDAAGLTWSLAIPGNALVSRQTITMTPLTGIESKTAPGPIAGGVLLEPDGLQFLAAATLTVRAPGGGKNRLNPEAMMPAVIALAYR